MGLDSPGLRAAMAPLVLGLLVALAVFLTAAKPGSGPDRPSDPAVPGPVAAAEEGGVEPGGADSAEPGNPAPAEPGTSDAGQPVTPHLAVPVLMYHVVAPGPNNLYVPPAELEQHLTYLAGEGYQTVTLRQLADHFQQGAPLPERPVVLTFDDGYESVYSAALPLLQKHGMIATFFIIINRVGQPGYITWEQLAEMVGAGMEIGSHTVTHPDLRHLQVTGQEWELGESRRILAERLQAPIEFLAYPGGAYNDETLGAMQNQYRGAVTTIGGLATPCQDRLLWHRVRINQGVGPKALGELLSYWEEESRAKPCAPPAWAEAAPSLPTPP